MVIFLFWLIWSFDIGYNFPVQYSFNPIIISSFEKSKHFENNFYAYSLVCLEITILN